MIHVYTHWAGFVSFHEKWHFLYEKYMKSTWKQLKRTWKTTKTADSTQISHFDLVFHRVQRKGQLSISYILVVFGSVNGACMCKWYMYTHILIWFYWFSWKVRLYVWKLALFMKSTEKQQKHLIQHRSLIMTWCFIEYRGNAYFVYVIFWWYLVELVSVNGACIHTYWPGFVCFHEKWHFSWKVHENHWKATRTADSTHISYYDLVFCRVQREGQLDIPYILVVFGGVCGACMFKWSMYTHIWNPVKFCCF